MAEESLNDKETKSGEKGLNKNILFLVLALIILVLILTFFWQDKEGIVITTDKTEYNLDQSPIITIQNNSSKSICLSDCYPYYLEKKNGQWQSYLYGECDREDLIKKCIEPGKAMGLEPFIRNAILFQEPGQHRIKVPFCVDCQVGQNFKEDRVIFSNEFIVKINE